LPNTTASGTFSEAASAELSITPPAVLAGKKLQLTTTAGGELITLNSATEFSSEIGADGLYTYSPASGRASFVANFETPAIHATDLYTLELRFSSLLEGTFSGNLFYDGQNHFVTGVFHLSP